MNDRNRNSVSCWLGAMVAASMLLAACGTSAEPPIATREPAPTFTPTTEGEAPAVDPAVEAAAATAAAQAAAPQEEPAAEQPAAEQPAAENPAATQPAAEEPPPAEAPTPEPTPTVAQAAEVVINSQMNVRGGPGTNYNIVGAANAGQRYPVTGKNNDGTWWQINFNGQAGWVFGELVTPQNTQAVAVAPNIPAPPPTNTPAPVPPTNTPAPPAPEQPPAEQPPAEEPPAEQPPANNDGFPFILGEGSAQCAPNAGNTYFSGFVRRSDNSLMNGVCVHIAFYGPRTTKCSGCDGVGDGIWGFNPFGGPADPGTQVEIFVVSCPGGNLPFGGQTEQSGFGDLTPQSPKWTRTINESEQCTGITFYER